MAKTYFEIVKEIERLQAEARAARQTEGPQALARIKEEISFFGFTPADLGFTGNVDKLAAPAAMAPLGMTEYAQTPAPAAAVTMAPVQAPAQATLPVTAAVQQPMAETQKVRKTLKLAKKKPRRKPSGFKTYRDQKGNVWSGQGHQPQWFKDALASGVKREEMLAGTPAQ